MRVKFYVASLSFSGPYAGCLHAEGDGTRGVIEVVPFEEISFPPDDLAHWQTWHDRLLGNLYQEFDKYQVGRSYPKPLRPWLRGTILTILQWRLGYHLLRGEVVELDKEQPPQQSSPGDSPNDGRDLF